MTIISENFQRIENKIRRVYSAADNKPREKPVLLAVTKNQSHEAIKEALDGGHRFFAENKVQEAQGHWSVMKDNYPDLKLHLVGPLQTNKASDAVALFDCIQSLDREKLARALQDEILKQRKSISCFIQVNTGEEEQKSGLAPSALPAFLQFCREECSLKIDGLMCIPPVDEPAALHFALLKKLAKENNLKELSMGMSADFEKAIALGATYIRVGTALFGART